MRYTTILTAQRAVKAVHDRDKTGHLHVSYDEVSNAVQALQELLDEIVEDGNKDERSARRAALREQGVGDSDPEPEDDIFLEDLLRSVERDAPEEDEELAEHSLESVRGAVSADDDSETV